MTLFDSHCHLDPGYFPEGAEAVLGRAVEAGVARFVVIGVGHDAAVAEAAVALAERRDDVRAAVGMHPHDASALDDALYARLAELAARPRVVAVGEIGLDHYYMRSPPAAQESVFRRMVGLGRELGKPLVVHTRAAPALTLRILEEERAQEIGGVVHCFSEDVAFARRALDLGFDLSFSGLVTFKNAGAVCEAARFAPADRILIETDSPYVAPVPVRGKRNEPANLAHTAQFLASLRAEPFEEVARRTSDNAARRFGWL